MNKSVVAIIGLGAMGFIGQSLASPQVDIGVVLDGAYQSENRH